MAKENQEEDILAKMDTDFETIPGLDRMSKSQLFVTKIGATFCCFLLVAIILVTTASVFWRYVLSTPLNFSDQLASYALAWICFVGAGVVQAHGEHVTVDFFERRMPEWLQKSAYLIYVICFSLFLITVTYYGAIYAWGVRGSIDPLLLNMSMMIPYLSVPVGCLYMLLQLKLSWNVHFNLTQLNNKSLGE